MPQTLIDIRRANERFVSKTGWLNSRHSFSFANHYDPQNTHFGLLLVSNDDIVQPGTGFMTHPHRDMEIVTWVLDGELEHKDSEGHVGLIVPGQAQRMSAGQGIFHSEINYSASNPVHFVQMWVLPDTNQLTPSYQETDISGLIDSGELVPIASGSGHEGAVRIQQRDAILWGARLRPGSSVAIPAAPALHLYVARGPVVMEGTGELAEGDAARISWSDGRRVSAPTDGPGAEILVWEFGTARS
ncbi:MAG: pirin family protein [Dehalococcoidia bacterium]